jgi:hypothetical protein
MSPIATKAVTRSETSRCAITIQCSKNAVAVPHSITSSPVPDLSRYQAGESSEEYRHRMIVNAVAFAYTSLLVIAGVCLALKMAH